MGLWSAGTGVPPLRGCHHDAEAGRTGAIDVLVPELSALGGGFGRCGAGAGSGWEYRNLSSSKDELLVGLSRKFVVT